MSENNGFDVNALLSQNLFTIPVELDDHDEEGNPVKRKLIVTYKFGPEQTDVFKTQEGRNTATQLTELVVKIKGLDAPLTLEYWQGISEKRRFKIGEAILNDVIPNETSSAA